MGFIERESPVRTDVALGDTLAKCAGRSKARLILFLMVIVPCTGSVMSSTGVVAILIPIVLRTASNSGA